MGHVGQPDLNLELDRPEDIRQASENRFWIVFGAQLGCSLLEAIFVNSTYGV